MKNKIAVLFDLALVKQFKQKTNLPLRIYSLLTLLLLGTGFTAAAQNTVVKGVITDARNGETLPYVSIQVAGTTFGELSDDEGNFTISMSPNHTKLVFTYVGYQTQEIEVKPGKTQVINIQMNVDVTLLSEVVVKAKGRYRNKDNPAVQLVRKVIEHKEENQALNNDYVEYEQYEKISFAMSNLSDKFKERKVFKNYQFLFKEQDSSAIGGKNLLPAYMHEKISDVYFRKSPHVEKHWIKAEKKAEFDSKFVDNEGLNSYFNRLYEDVNIYQNDISIATNLLLSPIANTAPTFYKFFIRDTVKTQEPWLVELGFVPRNKADLLFQGSLFVTLDGKYSVQYAYLTVNKDININFMRNLEATIEFQKSEDGRYYPSRTKLGMEFSLGKKGGGLYGQRVVNLKNYQINVPRPDSTYKGLYEEYLPVAQATKSDDSYWTEARHEPLDVNEQSIYRNIDTLQTIPSFRRTMSIATLFLAGYQTFKFGEIGPVNTFYSFNPVEGFRLRFGGRTTTGLSKRFYMESYAAYGFKDEKWKYFLSGTYSLNNKSVYHFPLHYIRASFQKDTKIPGQDLQFVQEDNFLLSFKRGNNMRWLYNDIYKLEYVREFPNRFSFKLGGTRWTQQPAGILEYVEQTSSDATKTLQNITTTEASLELRYAPKEQFYQGKLYRTPIINRYPIFTVRYNAGLKGALDGQYSYHNLYGSVSKRFYFSQFGFADVVGEGGYIFGKNIPFPLLNIHRANQTYAYQLNSFNMMNFLEFVSDHYAAINVQYYLNGFLFNKIPLFKKLKWREVLSYKMVYGGLRDENNPNYSTSTMLFPVDENGVPITYTLNNKPYAEASVGIANIFKLLRVDLVKRLNYLDNPNVAEWGIRARFRLDF